MTRNMTSVYNAIYSDLKRLYVFFINQKMCLHFLLYSSHQHSIKCDQLNMDTLRTRPELIVSIRPDMYVAKRLEMRFKVLQTIGIYTYKYI